VVVLPDVTKYPVVPEGSDTHAENVLVVGKVVREGMSNDVAPLNDNGDTTRGETMGGEELHD